MIELDQQDQALAFRQLFFDVLDHVPFYLQKKKKQIRTKNATRQQKKRETLIILLRFKLTDASR
jgi:hypothetical protein